MVDLITGANLNLTEPIRKGDKIKFVGDANAHPFPKLQGKCASSKTSLTKALTALEKTSTGFANLTQEEELLTKQRFARSFIEAHEKVETKKTDLETCFENLIEHVHDMTREDFEPHTDPTAIVESAESTCQERVNAADLKLQEHEGLVKQAEHLLSLQLLLKAVAPGPPQAGPSGALSGGEASLPVFRAQSDLKPGVIEKNSTFREVVHFVEIFFNYLVAGYGCCSTPAFHLRVLVGHNGRKRNQREEPGGGQEDLHDRR